jgi:hypothetical protein
MSTSIGFGGTAPSSILTGTDPSELDPGTQEAMQSVLDNEYSSLINHFQKLQNSGLEPRRPESRTSLTAGGTSSSRPVRTVSIKSQRL